MGSEAVNEEARALTPTAEAMGHPTMTQSDPRSVAVELYDYQKRVITRQARFTWNNWSRQTGKSFAFSLRRILRGMERGRNQIFLSASQTQSRELMIKAEQHLRAMQIACSAIMETDVLEDVKFKQLEIAVPPVGKGGRPFRIIGLPANPRTARGFTGDLLLDEFAMHQRDQDIYAAAFPTVSREGGELDVCSTPMGRQNMFYRLGQNPAFHHETVNIFEAVAGGAPLNIEELRAGCSDEEKWRQEFLCEFVDEATAFLTYEQIGECEQASLPIELDLAALRECQGDCVVGMDIGRKKDLTVIVVFEVDGRVLRCRGLLIMQGATFRDQFEVLAQVLRCRCVRRCAIDASGLGMELGENAVRDFGDYKVEACTLTGPFKEMSGSLMRNKFIDKLVQIPVEDKLRNDLHSVRKIVTAAGNIRLEAPRDEGSHADRFWAIALACYAGQTPTGKIEVTLGPELRMAGARRF
jgi:phage FluMu gp28-like protein